MGKLRIIFLVLILLKFCLHYLLSKKVVYNNCVEHFVEYEFEQLKWTNYNRVAKSAIHDWSRRDSKLYENCSDLLESLDGLDSVSTQEYISVFNNSRLKNIFPHQVSYQDNPGLSKEHNLLLCQRKTVNYLIEKLDSTFVERDIPLDRPYLVYLDTEEDSMTVGFTYGMVGPVENTYLTHNGAEHQLDSLPIQVGQVKGAVQMCIRKPSTKEKNCFKKEF